ncbi:MAG: polysaccharide biosynthesis PFTS motif protein [Flavobacteriales bacterium TMED96]|nr:MAG: polysaccharide biosynthesis PFTS motif protein [Flavobacteriales bacterium TMED96]|tara:strand:+ start:17822 stop:19405 length:1584 start_codon:yes stop_codon:yes gene_type:complete
MFKIKNWIKKRRRADLRSYMRGYIHLDKNNNTEYIDCLKRRLSETTIENKKFNSASKNPEEICLQQFLVYRLLDKNFNIEILKSLKKKSALNLNLPLSWRLLLEDEGFKVNTSKNKLNWLSFQLKWFIYGTLTGLKEVTKSFNNNLVNIEYVYFYDLSPKNFPISENDTESKNIVRWFVESAFSKGIKKIAHSAETNLKSISGIGLSKTSGPLPSLVGTKRFLFIFWLIKKFFQGILYSNQRILFREKIFLKILKLSSKKSLPVSYYFHNAWSIFKPLWTYEVEKMGIDVILYFYSTNIYTMIEKGKDEKLFFNPWLFSRWKKILAWNKSQELFINQKSSINSKIYKVGPIPFYSSKGIRDFKKNINNPKIVVFDVQPFKKLFWYAYAPHCDYYNFKNSKQFLSDINLLAKKIGGTVYIKRKRNTEVVSNSYIKLISRFVKIDKWIEIDPELDVFRLTEILNPDISINRPFTSTAHVTKSYNIPSIYYDPSKKLDLPKYSFIEIELINKYSKLIQWTKKNIKHKNLT